MGEPSSIRIIDRCSVYPPRNSTPTSSLPLTFFDIPWLLCRPMQRLFFYEFPHSTTYFIQTTLPSLKRSLSLALALQTFYPFSACIACPPAPAKPHILYTDGDSVPLTAAVSVASFDELTSNRPQDARLLHPLVPQLPPARVSGGTRLLPIFAVQVTVFPETGLCMGVQFLHAAADGRSFNQFMKSWASICKTGGDINCLEDDSLPFHERNVIENPNDLEDIFLKEWWNWASTFEEKSPSHALDPYSDKVRATFVLEKARINRLKNWLLSQLTDTEQELLHISTFVATCALTWVCLIRSKEGERSESLSDGKLDHICFVSDCRSRLETAIPNTYFGNCLSICFVPVQRDTLLAGQHGIVAAAKAIAKKVKELEGGGALRGAERWMLDWKEVSELGDLVTVAGSPRLKVYDTDFGWGRPRASRVVQIDVSGAIALAESREESGGGMEIGLALGKASMDAFSVMFEYGWEDGLGVNAQG